MTSIREDMVLSAVEFLQNPTIADAPLAKKIEFIESKGLTEDEVQEALLRAKGGNTQVSGDHGVSTPTVQSLGNFSSVQGVNGYSGVPEYYYNAPPLPERDWKDYFIMATATAGVSFGIYQIVKRYVLPKILPPSQSEIEKDKESVDQEFARVEAMLKRFEEEQRKFYEDQAAKSSKIDESLADIEEVISRTNEKNLSNEETLKYMKLEIESIKTTVIKNLESQKATISSELNSLDREFANLKRTMLTEINNRRKTVPSGTADSTLLVDQANPVASSVPVRPSIPPASVVPSAKDIFQREKSLDTDGVSNVSAVSSPNSMSNSLSNSNQSISTSSLPKSSSGIPAWQLSAS
ncbi:unnamed protein product [Kuraishia capsulata CBS 1993]|uniref:Peroxisomal membrane protein PEX14 n=1 Tax=Kuraishia capsulata CBS 1993 TaxID=1382522 RepID=W6MGJ2_9ASCO|nr:uncharacterized protein KUCA_T00001206001 [Kuraishia capsulata CBS 1993]CDK25239.1 unnamed protein product [Kuraishia capsulata CBS 1993]